MADTGVPTFGCTNDGPGRWRNDSSAISATGVLPGIVCEGFSQLQEAFRSRWNRGREKTQSEGPEDLIFQRAFAFRINRLSTSGVIACFGSSPMPWLEWVCASMQRPSAP